MSGSRRTTRRTRRPATRRSATSGRPPAPRTSSSSCSTTWASRRSSAFGGPVQHADGGTARRERPQVQPVPHHGAVLADAGGAPERPQPPRRRDGRDHRDRHVGAGLQLAAPEHLRAAGGDAQAQRLLHGPVRQMPRGPGLADQPDGPVRQLALGRRRLRVLLRVHRRRDEPVRAGDLPQHHAGRARPHARAGLPLHRGHDRQGDRLGAPAEGAHGRQALLHVLRARRNARAAPRPGGVVRQVQGPVRRRLGRPARADASLVRRSSALSPQMRC